MRRWCQTVLPKAFRVKTDAILQQNDELFATRGEFPVRKKTGRPARVNRVSLLFLCSRAACRAHIKGAYWIEGRKLLFAWYSKQDRIGCDKSAG